MKSLTIFLIILITLNCVIFYSCKTNFLKNNPMTLNLPIKSENKLMARQFETSKTNEEEDLDNIEPKVHTGNCFIKIDRQFYNLYPMSMKKGDHYTIKTGDGKTLYFNLCSDILTDCTNTKGLIVDKEKCIQYADTWKLDKTWTAERNI